MDTMERPIALLLANDFEDVEATYPYYRVQEDGHRVLVVGAVPGDQVRSKHGYPLRVDLPAHEALKREWAGVIIPGGYSPDHVRRSPEALQLVRNCDEQGRLVAAICHAGWVLASAGIARGRRLTSWWSIRDDMVNAGAAWEDAEVVIDGNLVTSRQPDDLPAFARAALDVLAGARQPV